MLNQNLAAVWLAWRDWKFEKLLSLCQVLALASMLAPILILQGVGNGVIDGMRQRLLEDPNVLIITPKSDGGRYNAEFISQLGNLPDAAYAVGRIRDTATDITLSNAQGGTRASIGLEPATEGEPVLVREKLAIPQNGAEPELILSAPAAKALKAEVGSRLEARLGRRTPAGKLESETLFFRVSGILPASAADRKMGFVALKLLEDMEDYRDYLAVPDRGLAGETRNGERQFASFRLYAQNLDAVEKLAAWLEQQRIETTTRSREIASIRLLKNAIDQVIWIIALAVGVGFAAFTLSSAQSAVARKRKMLGMLRLLGFRQLPMLLYPLTQALLAALAGFVLAVGIYLAVAAIIGAVFASQGSLSCNLTWLNLVATGGAVLLLSACGSAGAAWQAQAVEPSTVIRDI